MKIYSWISLIISLFFLSCNKETESIITVKSNSKSNYIDSESIDKITQLKNKNISTVNRIIKNYTTNTCNDEVLINLESSINTNTEIVFPDLNSSKRQILLKSAEIDTSRVMGLLDSLIDSIDMAIEEDSALIKDESLIIENTIEDFENSIINSNDLNDVEKQRIIAVTTVLTINLPLLESLSDLTSLLSSEVQLKSLRSWWKKNKGRVACNVAYTGVGAGAGAVVAGPGGIVGGAVAGLASGVVMCWNW